jgi:hypothetical protein
MLRAFFFPLLVSSVLTGSLQAQEAVATFQRHAAGLSTFSALFGQRSSSTGFSPCLGLPNGVFETCLRSRRDRQYASLLPYYASNYQPFWYEQSDARPASTAALPVVIEQRAHGPASSGEKPMAKSQVIEIPGATNSTAAKSLPPTIFLLTNGERVESHQFLLTVSNLSVSVDRHRRRIPLDMLDIEATKAANRQRGINLQIPADRNELVLSF